MSPLFHGSFCCLGLASTHAPVSPFTRTARWTGRTVEQTSNRHFNRLTISQHLVWCETDWGRSSAAVGSQIISVQCPCAREPCSKTVKSGEMPRGSLAPVRFGTNKGSQFPTTAAVYPTTCKPCRHGHEYDAPHRPLSTASCLNGCNRIGSNPSPAWLRIELPRYMTR
jgi:hypothetical protein